MEVVASQGVVGTLQDDDEPRRADGHPHGPNSNTMLFTIYATFMV